MVRLAAPTSNVLTPAAALILFSVGAAADYRFHDHHTVLKHSFQGSRTSSKDWEKKGGIEVHTVIHANEGVPSDIKFTSAATNDSFMLKPTTLSKGDIMAMDRAYIDYEKLA